MNTRRPFFSLSETLFFAVLIIGVTLILRVFAGWIALYLDRLIAGLVR
jgi:hypothetical protein